MANLKLNSGVSLKERANNTEVLTKDLFDKLNVSYQVLVKIAISDEIGIKMEDLRVAKYNENYYLAPDSAMLIHNTIFE